MKYFGGCDVGSTYTKAVILDEAGKMVADATIRSKINAEQSAVAAMDEVCKAAGLKSSKDLEYLIGTGYGRNKVPFADENISEISCHAMGVHVTNPDVRAIIDIGGQDVISGIVTFLAMTAADRRDLLPYAAVFMIFAAVIYFSGILNPVARQLSNINKLLKKFPSSPWSCKESGMTEQLNKRKA